MRITSTIVPFFALVLGAAACNSGGSSGNSEAESLPGAALFRTHCVACHTVGGGDLVGPDLDGVTDRREHDWLVRWIDDPVGMSRDDPQGQALAAEWPAAMLAAPIDGAQIEQVIAYIDAASAGTAQ